MAQIYDPDTVRQALAAGVGAEIAVRLGGKVDPKFGGPIETSAVVTHVSDGSFVLTGPMLTGVRADCGPTVGLRIGGVEVVVVSQRMQNYDLGFFRIGGIEPKDKGVLAVKSMQHFRGAYAPIAGEIVVVDEGGGITSHDIRRLPWQNVRQPVYPLHLD
jgi:microcystin degradation protein MlrC